MRRISLPSTRPAVAALSVAVLAAGSFAGYAWYGQHQAQQRDHAARTCLAAATPAAQAIFSYDYRTFDASVSNAQPFVTGTFAKDYASTTATLKSTAVKEQAVVQAQVSAVGLVEAGTGQVTVLVYLNQYRRNANITGEKVDQDRLVLTMVPAGGDCKVSQAAAI
jgi:Mce-associated membrane protein